MQGKNESTAAAESSVADREIVITRLINAPRSLVFKMWTTPEHLIKWWGPNGFRNTFIETDIRKGGRWKFIMHGPDGTDYPNLIVYDVIKKNERLEYKHGTGELNDPTAFSVVVEFEEANGKTQLTLRTIFATASERERVIREVGAIEGGNQTISKMEAHLKLLKNSENEFTYTRTVNAPLSLVWKMFSEEKHLKNWWGPQGMDLILEKFDFREGGMFHYSMTTPDGKKMYGKLVYHEIKAPDYLSFISSFSDENALILRHPFSETFPLELLSTMQLKEENGKTTIYMTGRPIDATDEEIKTFDSSFEGMKQGNTSMFDQFEAYLKTINK